MPQGAPGASCFGPNTTFKGLISTLYKLSERPGCYTLNVGFPPVGDATSGRSHSRGVRWINRYRQERHSYFSRIPTGRPAGV